MRVYHTTESYVALVDAIHQGRYDYSETVFTKMSAKVRVKCPEHGLFEVSAGNHKVTGCPACFNARRPTLKATPFATFEDRLFKFNPLLSVVDPSAFASMKKPVQLLCKHHGVFTAKPSAALKYKNICPGCLHVVTSAANKEKVSAQIGIAISRLPAHIALVTKSPGWSTATTLRCQHHGEFTTQLNRVGQMQYICNKCAQEAAKGLPRITLSEYQSWVARLFPAPPSAISVVAGAYQDQAGTKLVTLHCATHGEFTRNRSTINNGRLGTPCPFCKRHATSDIELDMVTLLRKHVPCEQGNRQVIAPKELDCWVPSHKLAAEMCGLYWHSEHKIDKTYHLSKLEACVDKGINLIQIFEDEWLQRRSICESILLNRLGVSIIKVGARKLTINRVGYKEAYPFLEENHIQGGVPSQYYFALVDGREIMAIATFSFNRLKKDGSWELVRYCSKLNHSVTGGLSRLVRHFMREQGVDRIISYCCRRWFTGRGYESAGFTLIGKTQPSYFYTDKRIRLSRYSATKKKIQSLLPSFDPELTETENMLRAGYAKIYDCGNLVYEFKA
jgi:hypothetical protein